MINWKLISKILGSLLFLEALFMALCTLLAKEVDLSNLDYVKLGPYLKHLGPLKSPSTNQRLYLVQHRRNTEPGNILMDLTPKFWKKP